MGILEGIAGPERVVVKNKVTLPPGSAGKKVATLVATKSRRNGQEPVVLAAMSEQNVSDSRIFQTIILKKEIAKKLRVALCAVRDNLGNVAGPKKLVARPSIQVGRGTWPSKKAKYVLVTGVTGGAALAGRSGNSSHRHMLARNRLVNVVTDHLGLNTESLGRIETTLLMIGSSGNGRRNGLSYSSSAGDDFPGGITDNAGSRRSSSHRGRSPVNNLQRDASRKLHISFGGIKLVDSSSEPTLQVRASKWSTCSA